MGTCPRFYGVLAAALLTLTGCDEGATSVLPAAPAALAPSPAPAETGRLDIALMTPGGNALICAADGSCNMMLAVDVQLDQDVSEPWITASFYNGSRRCGSTPSVRDSESIDPLRANTVTRLWTGSLRLTADQNGSFCTALTTMVLQVWGDRGRSPAPLLTREFPEYRTILVGGDGWDY
jgi:hypothetical protein